MVYRQLSPEDANALMSWADDKGVNYDWWNCHEFFNDDGSSFYEIGMHERDWDTYVTTYGLIG
jgi:hypothetical protein